MQGGHQDRLLSARRPFLFLMSNSVLILEFSVALYHAVPSLSILRQAKVSRFGQLFDLRLGSQETAADQLDLLFPAAEERYGDAESREHRSLPPQRRGPAGQLVRGFLPLHSQFPAPDRLQLGQQGFHIRDGLLCQPGQAPGIQRPHLLVRQAAEQSLTDGSGVGRQAVPELNFQTL